MLMNDPTSHGVSSRFLYHTKLAKLFLKNSMLPAILIFKLSLLLSAVSYSPFSNLLYKGIRLIDLTKSGFNSKFATTNVSGVSYIKAKLAGRKYGSLSDASIYSCVVSRGV